MKSVFFYCLWFISSTVVNNEPASVSLHQHYLNKCSNIYLFFINHGPGYLSLKSLILIRWQLVVLPLLPADLVSLLKRPIWTPQMRLGPMLRGSSDDLPWLLTDWACGSTEGSEACSLKSACSCNSSVCVFKCSIVLLIGLRLKPCSF